jgi:hypothetical protein
MKCGGTSVESAFYQDLSQFGYCSGDPAYPSIGDKAGIMHHTPPSHFFAFPNSHIYEDYTSVSIARNPYDAAVSYYWYIILKNQDRPDIAKQRICSGDSKPVIQGKFESVMLADNSQEDDPLAQSLGFSKQFLCPLVYLCFVNIRFFDRRVNYFLRYEDLEHQYKKLCRHLKIKANILPKHKKYPGRITDIHFSEYHTDVTRNVIESYFGDVNQAFSYKAAQ